MDSVLTIDVELPLLMLGEANPAPPFTGSAEDTEYELQTFTFGCKTLHLDCHHRVVRFACNRKNDVQRSVADPLVVFPGICRYLQDRPVVRHWELGHRDLLAVEEERQGHPQITQVKWSGLNLEDNSYVSGVAGSDRMIDQSYRWIWNEVE